MTLKKIRAIIVDDENLARKYLGQMLADFEEVEVVAECQNGFEAVKVVNELSPKLLFLDVQMPKLDGFEVLELLDTRDMAVVFVTAYDQYALKAFDSHAVDYLLKPFSKERLGKAIEKVIKNLGSGLPEIGEMRRAVLPESEFLSRVVVKDGGSISVIPCSEINYVAAEDDYINIVSQKGSVLKHQTLGSFEKSLDPNRFIRIHRSSLINIECLDGIELLAKDKYVAVLKDGTELRISRSGHKRLKEIIG